MRKRILFLFISLFGFLLTIQAQELNAHVTINSSKIPGTNKQVFTTLEGALTEFINNHKWTELTYAVNEKIDCNFQIIIQDYTDDRIKSTIQVSASRPIYGSSYTSSLINFMDKEFYFNYVEFDPIEVSDNQYESNLSAVIAYYAYVIIGLDLDSYSKYQGTPAFQIAEQICNTMQSGSGETAGWKAFDNDKNRYALISNLMDERFKPMREFYYSYHRLGLDIMQKNPTNGRGIIAKGLPILLSTQKDAPSGIWLQTFVETKADEIVNIFAKKGTQSEKDEAYDIMMSLDPTHVNIYDKIKQ